MAHHIITECPACTTRFQVTNGQLKIAGGKVRCGSCLEVFNAEVYRCDDLPEQDPELQSEANDQSHKDPLFDQIEVPAFMPPPRNTTLVDKRYSEPAVDELLEEQLNSDSSDSGFEPEPEETEQTDLEQPVQEIIAEQQHPETSEEDIQVEDKVEESTSTTDTEALIADLPSIVEIGSEVTLPVSESGLHSENPSQPEPRKAVPHQVEPQSIEAQSVEAISIEALSDEPRETEQEIIASQPFTRFQAEPVMIKTTREQRQSSIGWTLMTLLAMVILLSQYLWFNRQQLSVYPELSGFYTTICNQLPCNLSAPILLSKISTRQLVVTEHKTYQGALTVNLLIENKAAFSQPFPAIELTFSDRKGQLISQRLFEPDDYLKQSTVQPRVMPMAQPVQISFDILDPGRRAVSYEAILRIPKRRLQANL